MIKTSSDYLDITKFLKSKNKSREIIEFHVGSDYPEDLPYYYTGDLPVLAYTTIKSKNSCCNNDSYVAIDVSGMSMATYESVLDSFEF